jgi:hypothetical protein
MSNSTKGIKESGPRRSFFSHLGGMMVLGAAALVLKPLRAEAAAEKSDDANWPGMLKGRHKQLVDAYEINGGFPLGFMHNFLQPNEAANESAIGVIILRHGALPLALNHAMWEKYKIGETFKVNDPETKAPAKKNPYFQPKPGVLNNDDIAIDWLLGRGVIFGACAVPCGNRPDAFQAMRASWLKKLPRNSRPTYRHPIGRMGREPRPGGRLHVLRRRLTLGKRAAASRRCSGRHSSLHIPDRTVGGRRVKSDRR